MGVDPVTGVVTLGIVAGTAVALYLEECERENERRRRQEEDSRRWQREAKKRERDARRREKEREQQEKREAIEREREAEREILRMRRLLEISRRQEEEEVRRRRRLSNDSSGFDPFQTSQEYYRSQPPYYRYDRDFSPNSYSSYNLERNRNCICRLCRPESPRPEQHRDENYWSPFDCRENQAVSVTFIPPQTTQDKNHNGKNQGSSNQPSPSNSQGATTSGNASKTDTNAAPKASGSQQPQRNNNNNNNNNNGKKVTVQDYGKLNDFIKMLKAILDRCKVSEELRTKILSFFNNFQKHEDNFSRLLEDIRTQNIDIEDILSIVIRLFQSDYFAKDVAYQNFLALMEIVAKYIKDELILEMVEDSLRGNKKPFDKQREECMKKVLQRNNILSEITAMFENARKEIVEDNASKPLEPDFSGIFTKVYHYLKHKVVRGKEWTVKEYFDWIRKVLILLKSLTPEYVELSDVNHARREIVFEMYSTVYEGYFRIVVRAYGPILHICTFFLREKRDKRAKDGDRYVDGKKKT